MEHTKIKRSKDSIRNALLTLLKDKSIEKITISDLTREAKVNRSTFYSHYIDKINLIEDLESYFITEIDKTLNEKFENNTVEQGIIMSIQKLVYFALEPTHFSFLKLMLSQNGDPKFADKISESISKQIATVTRKENKASLYVRRFVSRGLLELMIVWLADDERPAPEEFIELVKKSQLFSPMQLVLHQNI